jgi:purine-binding chemotaxis protein CheW
MTAQTNVRQETDSELKDQKNQFVTFVVAEERFAAPMAPVQEIIRVPPVAKVPKAPPSLLGLANLRGRVLPIVSLRNIFGLPEVAETESSRALVINLGTAMGFVVDRVTSVISVDTDQLESAQEIQTSIRADLITGVIKGAQEDLTMVLDFDRTIQQEFANISDNRADTQELSLDNTGDVALQDMESELIQLVSFTVEGQEYAVAISDVQEIVKAPERIMQVPKAPSHILGIMRLRESLLPVVSLRLLLGLSSLPLNETQRVVVLRMGPARAVGVVVDSVNEVLRVSPREVEPVPAMLSKEAGVEEISSICRLEDGHRLVSVLDTAKMFESGAVKEAINQAASMEESMEREIEREEDHKLEEDEQVVIFRLGAEEFGVSITAVQEIIRVPEELVRVPKAPAFVEGVVNLRGSVLPVIDQRRHLGLPGSERNDRQRIMVYTLGDMRVGFIVDSVSEVLKIPKNVIEPAPRLSGEQERIIGRVANLQVQKRLVMLIDPVALLSRTQLSELQEAS